MNTRDWRWIALQLALGAFTLAGAQTFSHWDNGTIPPLHPTIIQGTYKGKTLPIVAVHNESPEVEVDGKLKRLPQGSRTGFTPQRGAMYAPGSVQLRAMNLQGSKTNMKLLFPGGGEVDAGTVSASTEFTVTVTPTQDYPDCYVALMFFDQGYIDGTTDQPGASVQFEAIKPLIGGKENKLKIHFGYVDFGTRPTGFFPLFFTHGLEIQTDQCELVARFFRHREMTIHEYLVKSHLEKNANQSTALKPYLQIPPLVPDDLIPPTPLSIDTTFMVSEGGTVESLQFESDVPTAVLSPLRRSLSGWLFLPRLKDGRPARTLVHIPLVVQRTKSEPAAAPGGT